MLIAHFRVHFRVGRLFCFVFVFLQTLKNEALVRENTIFFSNGFYLFLFFYIVVRIVHRNASVGTRETQEGQQEAGCGPQKSLLEQDPRHQGGKGSWGGGQIGVLINIVLYLIWYESVSEPRCRVERSLETLKCVVFLEEGYHVMDGSLHRVDQC